MFKNPESELDMARRHVAEQEERIVRQDSLIARLKMHGLATGDAEFILQEMHDLLSVMREHLVRLERS